MGRKWLQYLSSSAFTEARVTIQVVLLDPRPNGFQKMIDKSNKSILIIEDDDDLMEFYCAFLKQEFAWKGLDTATSGSDAKHILKTKEIDIVVSDFKIPDYDGLELLKKMHDKKVKIPKYIFITGFDSAQFRKSAVSLGAVTILRKPIDKKVIGELKDRLKIA